MIKRLIPVPEERFLSAQACKELLERAVKMSTGGGEIQISMRSRWSGHLRWARNEISSAGDTTDHLVSITRVIKGAAGSSATSRIDDKSLRDCIQRAEDTVRYLSPTEFSRVLRPAERYLETNVWSDATFGFDADARATLQRQLVEPAVSQGLMSAGYLEVAAIGNGVANTSGLFAYVPETRAEFSVTVRNQRGTGSGWAGMASKDLRDIDAHALAAVAKDKCTRSADPVAIEPGRYTVILEPQAVADLVTMVVASSDREFAEMGMGPWADGTRAPTLLEFPGGPPIQGVEAMPPVAMTKMGKRVLDPRITISASPTDPEMPFVPFGFDSSPMRPVTWIKDGVLNEMSYSRAYAIAQLNTPDPLNNSQAFRMSGGATSIEEMIRTTERGLLVTRLVNVRNVDGKSMLCTGTTSDGLWLIERGSITKAVKHFRFRESPLFIFNKIDGLGKPVRVLSRMPAIVPPVKVRDFSMTSLADAV